MGGRLTLIEKQIIIGEFARALADKVAKSGRGILNEDVNQAINALKKLDSELEVENE